MPPSSSEVTASLRGPSEAQSDLDVLDRWFDQALDAASLEQFRASLPPQTNGTASPPQR